MNTSQLHQELAPLNEQIEATQATLEGLEAELRAKDAELADYLADKERIAGLQDVCDALDRLADLQADELFWRDLAPAAGGSVEHLQALRGQIADFEADTRELEEQRGTIGQRIAQCLFDLEILDDEVRQAYAREERRQEEFAIEREMSPLPFVAMTMPWSVEVENERRFRKVLLFSLFWCVTLGAIIPMVTLPVIDRSVDVVEIPKRLATLVKETPPLPEPVPAAPREEKPLEPEAPKEETSEQVAKTEKPVAKPDEKPPVEKPAGGDDQQVARKKATDTGVLAFKSTFSDLMDEVPVAKLGSEARVKEDAEDIPGQARAKRSLVAMQAKTGTSGGISNHGISTNRGNSGSGGGGSGYGNAGQIGGVGFSRVESAVAGLAGEEGRPLSGGPGPGRTDEEIQIVFDRYKAALYRIYNRELRKDPTLQGKMLLRLTIEPEGHVSLCMVEATDLDSAKLVEQILARVERFNFGPKEGVPPTTILYPIDFLPAT